MSDKNKRVANMQSGPPKKIYKKDFHMFRGRQKKTENKIEKGCELYDAECGYS
jgi:hypothetical protein